LRGFGNSIQSKQKLYLNIDCPESLRVSGVVRVLSSERRVVRVVSSTVAAWRKQPDRRSSGTALPAPAVSPTCGVPGVVTGGDDD
jgi:hypothetical protein